MPSGDYIPCPICGNSMIYGNAACGTCMTRAGHPPEPFTLGKHLTKQEILDEDASLNELVDDVLGTQDALPTKEVPKFPKPIFDSDLFDELFAPQPDPKYKKTLVVNLFAGPGTGKSTTAAGIFFDLKNRQINSELAAEYAKDLVWEERKKTFEDQLYLFAKQHHRIFVLLGQVEVVVTDCPILLSPVYDTEKRATFEKLVVEEHSKMWTYNVFLKRKKAYNPKGRIHNEEQAHEIDRKVLDVLDRNNQCYETFDASPEGKDKIVQKILLLLEHNRLFGYPPSKEKMEKYFKPMPASERRNR